MTERRNVAALPSDASVRLQALVFENTHDAVVIADPDGRIREWNPRAAAMFGLDRGLSVGRPVSSYYFGEEGASRAFAIRAAAVQHGRWSGEVEYRRPDGSIGVRELVVVALRDPDGRLAGTAAISRDVTDQVRALRALEESERRYRLLFEQNPAGMYRTSRDGRILDFNAAFARILGYAPEELRALDARRLYFSDAERDDYIEALAGKRGLAGFECRLRTKDGSAVWVVENVTTTRGSDGETTIEGSLIDATDRHEVEEALRASEERYRLLFDRSPYPMWVYEPDTLRFVEVNAAAVAHYGYSRKEFLSMTLLDIRPPEERKDFRQHVSLSAEHARPLTLHRHRLADGTAIEAEVSAVDVPGGPRPRRMVLARDVTDRVRAESALRRSDEKHRRVIDRAPIGFFQATRDGRLLHVNSSFARTFGFESPAAMLSGPGLHAFDGDSGTIDSLLSAAAAGEIAREAMLRRRDGTPVWLHFAAYPVAAEPPDSPGIEGFALDISERKIGEEQRGMLQTAVIQTAREWRGTFDAIDMPILLLDSAGVIQRLNRAAASLAVLPFTEIIGRSIDDIGSGEPWRGAGEILRSAEGFGQSLTRRDDESGRTWELSIRRFGADENEKVRSIVVAHDVTTVIELQRSLIRSQSMAAIGSLVAGVAHEVRNPLFAISSTLDALELRLAQAPEYHRYGVALRTQVERMTNVMRDLLEFAKPVNFEREEIEAAEIAGDAARVCEAAAKEREVRIECDVPGGLRVIADRARTVQVFVNLIENAVQHSPAGGAVRIGGARCGSSAVWTVDDEGPGFRPEDLTRVFEPFFTRRTGGTGLGLAIVRRILTEQEGSVSATNREGRGARLEVVLPLAAVQKEQR